MPLYSNLATNTRVSGTIEALAAHLYPGMPLHEAKDLMSPFLYPDAPPLTLKRALLGAWGAIKSGILNPPAHPDEIRRRAGICNTCPQRVYALSGECLACGNELGDHLYGITRMLGREGTSESHPYQGQACNVCGCSLALLLQAELSSLSDEERFKPARPSHCWMRS